MRIDLHTHSRASDGTERRRSWSARRAAAGLDVVALTDHDTADGLGGGRARPRARSASSWSAAWRSAPGTTAAACTCSRTCPTRRTRRSSPSCSRILDGRDARLPAMLRAAARARHRRSTSDDVRRRGRRRGRDRPPARRRRAGRARAWSATATEAFAPVPQPGPARRTSTATPPRWTRCSRIVAEAGGVTRDRPPVGPARRARPDEAALAGLAELGLAGIEVDHQDHDAPARERLRAIARNLDLVVTGSSDYHGTGKIDHELGCNTTAPEEYAPAARARRAAGRGRAVRARRPGRWSALSRGPGYLRPRPWKRCSTPVGHDPRQRS